MRYPRTRHTLSPSTRPVHHGRRTIVGRLAVLSVFMLLLGVTSTQAQRTGQDPRCANFSGQAKGLCTAAVAAGCFESVQSPDCDALTTTWTERCGVCEGAPPWAATCPCADAFGSAVELYERFLALQPTPPIEKSCEAADTLRRVLQNAADPSSLSVASDDEDCTYILTNRLGEQIGGNIEMSLGEAAACLADIRSLQALPGVCPTPD
jgi:hypothetical protein